MARFFTSGFELNSTTSNVEWNSVTGAGSTIQATTVRSGSYAGHITSLSSGTRQGFLAQFASSYNVLPFFVRAYVYVGTLPSAENTLIALVGGTALSSPQAACLTLDNSGVFRLYSGGTVVSGGTLITGSSAAISTGAWHCLEMWIDQGQLSGSRILKARLDGASEFAASTSLSLATSGTPSLCLGANLNAEAQTTGNWYFDDIAINDGSGTAQNSYPGPGQCIVLRPAGTGDSNGFANQTGGTAGAANNFTRVDEVTPDNTTSFNGSHTAGLTDMFTMTASGIGATDVVSVVAANVRLNNNTATAVTALRLQIEKASAGTISQSADIIPNSTTWTTNASTTTMSPLLTLYKDPDGANWTQATLDTMQAGYTISTGGTFAVQVSTLWVYVDSTPLTATQATKDSLARFRLSAALQKNAASRLRLASAAQRKDTSARLRLASAALQKDARARLLLLATVPKDVASRLRLASAAQQKDMGSRVRLASAAQQKDARVRVLLASASVRRDTVARLPLSATLQKDAASRLRLAPTFYTMTRFKLNVGSTILGQIASRLRYASESLFWDAPVRFLLSLLYLDAPARFVVASAGVRRDMATRLRFGSPPLPPVTYNDHLTLQARVLTHDDYDALGGFMTLTRANMDPVTYSFSAGDFLCHKWVGTVADSWIETQNDFALSGWFPVSAPDESGFVIYAGPRICEVSDLDNGFFSSSMGYLVDDATFFASHTLNRTS